VPAPLLLRLDKVADLVHGKVVRVHSALVRRHNAALGVAALLETARERERERESERDGKGRLI
jgi:hypothetical protein